MIKSDLDVSDITHYGDVTQLLNDLRKIESSFDQPSARLMIRSLLHESRHDWIVQLLEESKGSSIADRLIEASLFELPITTRGSAGVVKMVLTLANIEIEVMSFKVDRNREGLLIDRRNLITSQYSDSVRSICFEAMTEALAEHKPAQGVLVNDVIQIDEEELSFLNGLTIETTTPKILRSALQSLGNTKIAIEFQKRNDGLLIKVDLQFALGNHSIVSSWNKIRGISKAGSSNAVVLGPGIRTAPTGDEKVDSEIAKSSALVEAEMRLQMELISLAQSLEHMRSIEASGLRHGRANTKLINQCLKGIERAKLLVKEVRKQGSYLNFNSIQIGLRETLNLLPSAEESTHSLVRSQIDQIPLRHRRLVEAYELLYVEVQNEQVAGL